MMPGSVVPGVLAGMPEPAPPQARVSEPGQDATGPAAPAADPAPAGMFIVEHRLPGIGQQQLAVLPAALSGAADRYAFYQTTVTLTDGLLMYAAPPGAMWPIDRYVTLLMGEVPGLTHDANGYEPAGRGYIAHVGVPSEVRRAFTYLHETADFATRAAGAQWPADPTEQPATPPSSAILPA
jgi:hypothetical protein